MKAPELQSQAAFGTSRTTTSITEILLCPKCSRPSCTVFDNAYGLPRRVVCGGCYTTVLLLEPSRA